MGYEISPVNYSCFPIIMITTLPGVIYSVPYVVCKVWYKLFALMKIRQKRRGDMILNKTVKDLIISNNELNK